jgi:hypothetical protein
MLIYDLICNQGHPFEGWFPDYAAFQEQQSHGYVTCPVCASRAIVKVPSGGHVGHSRGAKETGAENKVAENSAAASATNKAAKTAPPAASVATGDLDPVIVAKAIRHYVKTQFQNVGKQFTEQARQMCRGEIPQKNIYGEASSADLRNLADEEIPFFPLPELPPEFEN